jgi:hypothetical protein
MFRSSQSWNAGSADDDIIGSLKLALAETHCGVTVQDRDLNYLHIFNMPSIWPLSEFSKPTEIELFGAMLGEKLTLAKLALVATKKSILWSMAKLRLSPSMQCPPPEGHSVS